MTKRVLRQGRLLLPLVASLAACTSGDGLPFSPSLPPAQPPIVQPLTPRPDLALPNAGLPDMTTAPDLSPAPQTIGFEIAEFTGSGISGDTTMVSLPLPTPTTTPVDGIDYLYKGLRSGQYEMTLEWQDKSANNRGWTASFGGVPGLTQGWPIVRRHFTNYLVGGGTNDFGPDKVALIAAAGAQPNTLIITIRSLENPQTDYGVLMQGIEGY